MKELLEACTIQTQAAEDMIYEEQTCEYHIH